jgi:hypothetical protein
MPPPKLRTNKHNKDNRAAVAHGRLANPFKSFRTKPLTRQPSSGLQSSRYPSEYKAPSEKKIQKDALPESWQFGNAQSFHILNDDAPHIDEASHIQDDDAASFQNAEASHDDDNYDAASFQNAEASRDDDNDYLAVR